MVAVREQILSAIVTLLGAIDPGITVTRNKDVEVAVFPSLNVVDGAHEAEHAPHGYTTYRLDVTIEIFATASESDDLGTAMNVLYSQVLIALFTDVTLGGLAIDVVEESLGEPEVGRAAGQGATIGAPLDVVVEFMTPIGNPEVVGP